MAPTATHIAIIIDPELGPTIAANIERIGKQLVAASGPAFFWEVNYSKAFRSYRINASVNVVIHGNAPLSARVREFARGYYISAAEFTYDRGQLIVQHIIDKILSELVEAMYFFRPTEVRDDCAALAPPE